MIDGESDNVCTAELSDSAIESACESERDSQRRPQGGLCGARGRQHTPAAGLAAHLISFLSSHRRQQTGDRFAAQAQEHAGFFDALNRLFDFSGIRVAGFGQRMR